MVVLKYCGHVDTNQSHRTHPFRLTFLLHFLYPAFGWRGPGQECFHWLRRNYTTYFHLPSGYMCVGACYGTCRSTAAPYSSDSGPLNSPVAGFTHGRCSCALGCTPLCASIALLARSSCALTLCAVSAGYGTLQIQLSCRSSPPPHPSLRPIIPPPVRFEDGLVEVGLALVAWSYNTAAAWGVFMRSIL